MCIYSPFHLQTSLVSGVHSAKTAAGKPQALEHQVFQLPAPGSQGPSVWSTTEQPCSARGNSFQMSKNQVSAHRDKREICHTLWAVQVSAVVSLGTVCSDKQAGVSDWLSIWKYTFFFSFGVKCHQGSGKQERKYRLKIGIRISWEKSWKCVT